MALRMLRVELHDALQLPVNIWNLSALRTLNIEKCMRITGIPTCTTQLSSLTFLHIDDCTRLVKMEKAPQNLHTLRITFCQMFARVPENLPQLLMLTTLEFHELAVKSLPDMQMLSAMKSLRVATCKHLVAIGALPVLLETLIISECDILAAMPENMQFLFELETLELENLPLVTELVDVSLFSKLQRMCVVNCMALLIPTFLPVTLVHASNAGPCQ